MANIIGVRFENAGKLYFFDAKNLWPTPGDFVIVETSRGMEFGEMVTTIQSVDETRLNTPLMPLLRIASAQDVTHHRDNQEKEKNAQQLAKQKIAEHQLDMKLVKTAYTFDNSKLMFYYTAEGRVDFRALVKDLASMFHVRIEMRQIGVRDEAKMLGGLGPCGRPLCCSKFLGDFQPVSIKMAKEQNLSLNPTKISGVCGRLMCCLKFEQDHYETMHKLLPKQGKEVVTPDGPGTVWEVNVITERIKVRVQKGEGTELKEYPAEQVVKPGMTPPLPKEQQLHDFSPAFAEPTSAPVPYVGKHTLKKERLQTHAHSVADQDRDTHLVGGQRPSKGDRASAQGRQPRQNKGNARKPLRPEITDSLSDGSEKKELRKPIKRDAGKKPAQTKHPALPDAVAAAAPSTPARTASLPKGMAAPVIRSNPKNGSGNQASRPQSNWLAAVQQAKQKAGQTDQSAPLHRMNVPDEDDTI